MRSVLKIAILGTGPIAEYHINRQLKSRVFKPVAIFGKNQDRRRYLANKYNLVDVDSLEDCLTNDIVDVVDVSTTNDRHFYYALSALNHNKAVIVEKPVAFTIKEIDILIKESKVKAKPVLVVFQKRYNWTFQKLFKEIKLGKLGKFLHGTTKSYYPRSPSYYASRYKSRKKYAGGGALIYQGIHDLDLVIQLIGSVCDSSGELSHGYHQLEVEDTANICLENLDGGTLEFSTSTNPKMPKLAENYLCFERGSACFNDEMLVIEGSELENSSLFRLGAFKKKKIQILRDLRGNYDDILNEMEDRFWKPSNSSLCCLSGSRETHRIIESVYSNAQGTCSQ